MYKLIVGEFVSGILCTVMKMTDNISHKNGKIESAGLNQYHPTFPGNIYGITALLLLLSDITGALVEGA